MKYYIGIDLGGTNIVAGVVNESYEILAKASVKTNLPSGRGDRRRYGEGFQGGSRTGWSDHG